MNINESANKEREEYGKRAEYNREHLPSKELPPLSPDWVVLSEFILKLQWQFVDEGDRYRYFAEFTRGRIYVPKSELGNDSVKVIELLQSDVDKLYSSSDDIVGKGEKLQSFLMEKYPKFSEKAIERIVFTFCNNSVW